MDESVNHILKQVQGLSDEEKFILIMRLQTQQGNEKLDTPSSMSSRTKAAVSWLQCNYEEGNGTYEPKQDVYDKYMADCDTIGQLPVSGQDFGKIIKMVFPSISSRRIGQRGQSRSCYGGVKQKMEGKQVSPHDAFHCFTNVEPCQPAAEDSTVYQLSCQIVLEWASQLLDKQFSDMKGLAEYLISIGLSCGKAAAKYTLLSGSTGSPKSSADKKSTSCRLVQRRLEHNEIIRRHKEKVKEQLKQKRHQAEKSYQGLQSTATETSQLHKRNGDSIEKTEEADVKKRCRTAIGSKLNENGGQLEFTKTRPFSCPLGLYNPCSQVTPSNLTKLAPASKLKEVLCETVISHGSVVQGQKTAHCVQKPKVISVPKSTTSTTNNYNILNSLLSANESQDVLHRIANSSPRSAFVPVTSQKPTSFAPQNKMFSLNSENKFKLAQHCGKKGTSLLSSTVSSAVSSSSSSPSSSTLCQSGDSVLSVSGSAAPEDKVQRCSSSVDHCRISTTEVETNIEQPAGSQNNCHVSSANNNDLIDLTSNPVDDALNNDDHSAAEASILSPSVTSAKDESFEFNTGAKRLTQLSANLANDKSSISTVAEVLPLPLSKSLTSDLTQSSDNFVTDVVDATEFSTNSATKGHASCTSQRHSTSAHRPKSSPIVTTSNCQVLRKSIKNKFTPIRPKLDGVFTVPSTSMVSCNKRDNRPVFALLQEQRNSQDQLNQIAARSLSFGQPQSMTSAKSRTQSLNSLQSFLTTPSERQLLMLPSALPTPYVVKNSKLSDSSVSEIHPRSSPSLLHAHLVGPDQEGHTYLLVPNSQSAMSSSTNIHIVSSTSTNVQPIFQPLNSTSTVHTNSQSVASYSVHPQIHSQSVISSSPKLLPSSQAVILGTETLPLISQTEDVATVNSQPISVPVDSRTAQSQIGFCGNEVLSIEGSVTSGKVEHDVQSGNKPLTDQQTTSSETGTIICSSSSSSGLLAELSHLASNSCISKSAGQSKFSKAPDKTDTQLTTSSIQYNPSASAFHKCTSNSSHLDKQDTTEDNSCDKEVKSPTKDNGHRCRSNTSQSTTDKEQMVHKRKMNCGRYRSKKCSGPIENPNKDLADTEAILGMLDDAKSMTVKEVVAALNKMKVQLSSANCNSANIAANPHSQIGNFNHPGIQSKSKRQNCPSSNLNLESVEIDALLDESQIETVGNNGKTKTAKSKTCLAETRKQGQHKTRRKVRDRPLSECSITNVEEDLCHKYIDLPIRSTSCVQDILNRDITCKRQKADQYFSSIIGQFDDEPDSDHAKSNGLSSISADGLSQAQADDETHLPVDVLDFITESIFVGESEQCSPFLSNPVSSLLADLAPCSEQMQSVRSTSSSEAKLTPNTEESKMMNENPHFHLDQQESTATFLSPKGPARQTRRFSMDRPPSRLRQSAQHSMDGSPTTRQHITMEASQQMVDSSQASKYPCIARDRTTALMLQLCDRTETPVSDPGYSSVGQTPVSEVGDLSPVMMSQTVVPRTLSDIEQLMCGRIECIPTPPCSPSPHISSPLPFQSLSGHARRPNTTCFVPPLRPASTAAQHRVINGLVVASPDTSRVSPLSRLSCSPHYYPHQSPPFSNNNRRCPTPSTVALVSPPFTPNTFTMMSPRCGTPCADRFMPIQTSGVLATPLTFTQTYIQPIKPVVTLAGAATKQKITQMDQNKHKSDNAHNISTKNININQVQFIHPNTSQTDHHCLDLSDNLPLNQNLSTPAENQCLSHPDKSHTEGHSSQQKNTTKSSSDSTRNTQQGFVLCVGSSISSVSESYNPEAQRQETSVARLHCNPHIQNLAAFEEKKSDVGQPNSDQKSVTGTQIKTTTQNLFYSEMYETKTRQSTDQQESVSTINLVTASSQINNEQFVAKTVQSQEATQPHDDLDETLTVLKILDSQYFDPDDDSNS